jgi:pSer/pThr/pTyr-binding forkhead associated (FHA) protein
MPHLRLATTQSDTPVRSESRVVRGRKDRPLDGTLQFLPGRLEIVDGRDVGQEVRFVRQPGEDTTVVTFGRSEGVPYRHVQLHEPTVSRVHAKMSLEGKRWRLTNMSKTNPVVVNGQPLEGEDASMVLTEGDRVEMGEVVFKFRVK